MVSFGYMPKSGKLEHVVNLLLVFWEYDKIYCIKNDEIS